MSQRRDDVAKERAKRKLEYWRLSPTAIPYATNYKWTRGQESEGVWRKSLAGSERSQRDEGVKWRPKKGRDEKTGKEKIV